METFTQQVRENATQWGYVRLTPAGVTQLLAEAFEQGARHYAAADPCCGTYHLHEIENPHTGEPIPTRDGEDDL